MRWITTTAGQRAVTMEDGASTPIIVKDFNPYPARSARAPAAAGGHLRQRCDWIEDLPNGNVMKLNANDSVLAAGLCSKMTCSRRYVEVVKLGGPGGTSQEDELSISSFDVRILG
ncbi:hypothetical protein BGY98DRAFT_1099655 [Russula aff. rugulosa BPL654]|nr:hypothetical protein BGY98DRAFT_1099655 [Russula aff. rugulosa BPL654]